MSERVDNTPLSELEQQAFDFLCRKYVQRADARQQSMGLQYTEAETHDLAKQVARFTRTQASGGANDGRCYRCPDWTRWESDLKRAAVKDAEPISDEELDRFRHALADVHCKSSSRERDEVEYRLQRFGAKMWRKILARLDAAEASGGANAALTGEVEALKHDLERVMKRENDLLNANAALIEALEEARLQLEYLDGKFAPTGTTETVLARIRAALARDKQHTSLGGGNA
jgi:hypothetical protein